MVNFYIAKVNGAEKLRTSQTEVLSLPLTRGVIYVTRTVVGNGKAVEVPVRLDRQDHFKQWTGCWSAL